MVDPRSGEIEIGGSRGREPLADGCGTFERARGRGRDGLTRGGYPSFMNRLFVSVAAMALVGVLHATVHPPCLWDRDTREMERQRFPSVLEVVTGKFLRHSDAYYQWRVADRTERRAAGEQSPEVLDDLAVAYSKLGDDGRAIALMEEQERLHPGRYETLANLGTFHVHAGHLEVGAEFIEQALAVNPDAHFGRERYQLLLVRYLLASRPESGARGLPLCHAPANELGAVAPPNFWAFLADDLGVDPARPNEQAPAIAQAVEGLLGMLRFGNHDSPILLEVLSDLLLADHLTDAKGLGARALLRAAEFSADPGASSAYRAKARKALPSQMPESGEYRSVELEELEAEFANELAEADAWWQELRRREAAWVAAGVDLDARFAEVYYTSPVLGGGGWRRRLVPVVLGLGVAVMAAAALLLARRRRGAAAVVAH